MNQRRRIPYLLLTMPIVAALGLYFAHATYWIHQRHALLRSQGVQPYLIGTMAPRAPKGLWLLGESGCAGMYVSNDFSPETIQQIQRLFPEATIEPQPWEPWERFYLSLNNLSQSRRKVRQPYSPPSSPAAISGAVVPY